MGRKQMLREPLPEARCAKCGDTKPATDFPKCAQRRHGMSAWCRACHKAEGRMRWLGRDAEFVRNLRRQYYVARVYGLTAEQHQALYAQQEGRCAICKAPGNMTGDRTTTLAVDHCHVTNRVRGLLCVKCNQGLGHFHDTADFLRSAATYLETTHARS